MRTNSQSNFNINCRFCNTKLEVSFVDLGMTPLCQKHVTPEELNSMEKTFPLEAYVCHKCWLVQLKDYEVPEVLFSDDYAYYSSYSDSWLDHISRYTDNVIDRFNLNSDSFVSEIASNDGYLLQYFNQKGIPVLGVEPAGKVADVAIKKGIPTEKLFFGVKTANDLVTKYGKADLLAGNNVLAHVPDINDFVGAMKIFLKDNGVITIEFPHLQNLIEQNQFDTIYHEHFSYLSLTAVFKIFKHHGLIIFDVEELSTHGGSLRIYAKHLEDMTKEIYPSVENLLKRELYLGFKSVKYYESFSEKVKETKRSLLDFLIKAKREGKTIVGYGAPGKGNTLLNYCGIKTDFIDYTVDRSPHKQNNYLPGSHIPIYAPDKIKETKPDYILILPWNLKTEIITQLKYVEAWGGKFVIPIPEVEIITIKN